MNMKMKMNMKFEFIKQYILHPKTTGAIMVSSNRLAERMISSINLKACDCIVEYGPGTGVFTEKILERRGKQTKVILLEYNREFYKILKEKYEKEEGVYIINDSAEAIDLYLKEYNIKKVDVIISGLPFASLPKAMSETILEKTKNIIGDKGKFITFQYSKVKKDLIKNYFNNVKWEKELFNIPPAYVLSCNNR